MTESDLERQQKIKYILKNLDQDEQKLLSEVVMAEEKKLHMKQPRNINDDLWEVLERVIK